MIDMKMNLKLNYDRLLYVSFALVLVACESSKRDSPLYLPDGFEATVFVDSISETVRHMAVNKNGDLYGGYYSKEDIREIVEYAKIRHIEIIPEIELPGHSVAAIASYPNLSCTGKKINVETDWGVFKDIYCAGEDSVFTFLEGVLSEVVELFPSKYIHIGGDEAPKYRWENCSKCQKRILENKLKDEHELQSYFIQRIEKFLAKKGKKIMKSMKKQYGKKKGEKIFYASKNKGVIKGVKKGA